MSQNFILRFTDEADFDIKEATEWYEEKRVGLGDEFLLSIEAICFRIQRNPLLF